VNLEAAKDNAIDFGKINLALLTVFFLFKNNALIYFLGLLALPLTVWILFFFSTTVFASILQPKIGKFFQVIIVLIFPLVLSIYFINDPHGSPLTNFLLIFEKYSFLDLIKLNFTKGDVLGILVVLFFIGYGSWGAGGYLDPKLPFRGYIIAATILFVLCLIGSGRHSYKDMGGHALFVATSGKLFARYFLFIITSYIPLTIHFGLLCIPRQKFYRLEDKLNPHKNKFLFYASLSWNFFSGILVTFASFVIFGLVGPEQELFINIFWLAVGVFIFLIGAAWIMSGWKLYKTK